MGYNEYNESYKDLQPNKNDLIHQRHQQCLDFEIFESLMHVNLELMWSCNCRNPIPCDLRKESKLFLPQLNHFASG